MNECWPGFHTFDVEMAIDDLKEIYRQKILIQGSGELKGMRSGPNLQADGKNGGLL